MTCRIASTAFPVSVHWAVKLRDKAQKILDLQAASVAAVKPVAVAIGDTSLFAMARAIPPVTGSTVHATGVMTLAGTRRSLTRCGIDFTDTNSVTRDRVTCRDCKKAMRAAGIQ